MTVKLLILLTVVLALSLSSVLCYAGGDKVRGENGLGAVNQVQIENPPPFQ